MGDARHDRFRVLSLRTAGSQGTCRGFLQRPDKLQTDKEWPQWLEVGSERDKCRTVGTSIVLTRTSSWWMMLHSD